MSWKLTSRFKHLRMILAMNGAEWKGLDSEFVEFIHRSIPHLDKEIQKDAYSFYVLGQGRPRDENGLFTKESTLFHQNVKAARRSFSFHIKAKNDKELEALFKEN